MPTIDSVEYDQIPPQAVYASRIVADQYIKLGKPKTPFSESGRKMMDIIIAVWEDCYPLDRETYYAKRKEYQANEMTAREQVRKQTGRSLGSYPYPIYRLMKKVFVGFDAAERKNMLRMIKIWPMFRFTNVA